MGLLLTRLIYRVQLSQQASMPTQGGRVMVCSPMRPIHALLVLMASPSPICFALPPQAFARPGLGRLLRAAGATLAPINAGSTNNYAVALAQVKRGATLCFFVPDSSHASALTTFSSELQRLLAAARAEGAAVPLIPLTLTAASASLSSRPLLLLCIGAPLGPDFTAQDLQPSAWQARAAGPLRADQ